MDRRSFLKVVGGVAGGYAVASVVGCKPDSKLPKTMSGGDSPLPQRLLGKTGEKISIVGFPGLALMRDEQEVCTKALHSAFDQGVNHFDVAPAYGKDGICEIRMGIGMQDIPRDKYFLSCKTKRRDKEGARLELERSLKRLKTDHFDLYQLHHLRFPDEVKKALAPGGAMETILKAKEEGKIRYIGFSAHTTKGALEAMKGFKFDTVMFPINFVEYYTMGFGKPVLELAQKQGAAVLAIKPLSAGAWPQGMQRSRKWWYRCMETQEEVNLAMNFALSLKPVVVGIPPSWFDLTEKAIEAGRQFKPITREETELLQTMARDRLSVFKREEDQVAFNRPCHEPYPDNPRNPCPHA